MHLYAHTLGTYLTAVAIIWVVILIAAKFWATPELFRTLLHVLGGFAIGMTAMYIAVHVYGMDF